MIKHGTPSGYNYHGCRCDLCRAAFAACVRKSRNKSEERKRKHRLYTQIAYYRRKLGKGCKSED